MNAIRLYGKLIWVSLRAQMAYRTSFFLGLMANAVMTFVDFVAVYAFFLRFGRLGTWSFAEVALFYGMANMALALSELWLRGFDIFERHVKAGDLDRILTRPRTAFLQVLGSDFQLLRLGRIGVGAFAVFWGISHLALSWGAAEWCLFWGAVLGGNFLFGGIVLIRAAVSIWTVESLELFNMITYGGVETVQYPIDVYTGFLKRFFCGVVPLAAINYWPLCLLLGKGGVPEILAFISPLISASFFGFGLIAWRIGLKKYRSTGS